MPVRKVPPSYRSRTGFHASKKSEDAISFESSVERDFIILMDFDMAVVSIEDQPVRIDWQDERGRKHHYTPDFLIHFKPPGEQFPPYQPGKVRPWLVEIKDEKTLREKWLEFRPRFRAAVAYARKRGWIFHLFVERRIRSVRLDNARLLLPALEVPEDPALCARLLRASGECGEITALALVDGICREAVDRTDCLRALWLLVARRRIEVDLNLPLGMNSRLYLPGSHFVDALIRPCR